MFMSAIERNEKRITENGAIGYKTTGHHIVDLNFAIPSFRTSPNYALFLQSLYEDERLTLKWLLYLRDIRGGVGERKSFRDFARMLATNSPELAVKFFNAHIEEYGRWDDLIDLYFTIKARTREQGKVLDCIKNNILAQIEADKKALQEGKGVSLLAKWLPSVNASSAETKKRARVICGWLGCTERQYRKFLAIARKKIDVVEVKMSANNWESIDYQKVPSKANLLYNAAFFKHDQERREDYVESLKKGEAKINASALFLHDIVYKYTQHTDMLYQPVLLEKDDVLEAMWAAQPKMEGFSNTLVVRDGSGSMCCPISPHNSRVSALDVADALAIYCARNNQGEFKNKFITFSNRPRLVKLGGRSLLGDLMICRKETEIASTNIEAVFNLVLRTAENEHLSQEELPASILVISDMEFNSACHRRVDEALFKTITRKYYNAGYKLPKLIFWNVNSRTNTIPLTQNEAGVILLSGFSTSLMKMVMSSKLDPYEALKEQLNVPRYAIIDELFD